MKKVLVFALAALVLSGFAGAETLELTVDQAVELAVARNLGLKQSAIDVRTRERSKDTAWNAFLPSMSLSAGFNGTAGIFQFQGVTPPTITDPGAIGFSTGVNLSLPINAGVGPGIKNLVADYEAGLIAYEDAQKQLERDVRKQFFGLIANKENIRINQANLDLAQRRYEQARANFENGLSPELEVLGAEVTVANLRPALDGVVAGYESQQLFFKFLLGVDRGVELVLNGDLETDLHDLDAEKLIAAYLPGRLDIRGLDKQMEALGYAKKATALNFNTPSLNLGYSWGLSGSNSTETGFPPTAIDPWSDWADRGTLSLGIQWKFDGLIPGSGTDVQLKELGDALDALALSRQIVVENAGIEITNAVNNLATYRRTIEANTSSVELARRTFLLTEEAFNVGTRELLDVEEAQNDLLSAAQQLLLAKYQYVSGLLDLEYALNAPRAEFLAK